MIERSVVVALKEGLHARPAAQFTRLAKGFDADIKVVKNGRVADAKSFAKVMLLAVQQGESIVLRANGKEAQTALERLHALVSDVFENAAPAPAAPEAAAPRTDGEIVGSPGHPGMVVGPAFIHLPELDVPVPYHVVEGEKAAEAARLEAALDAVHAAFAQQAAAAEEPNQREILDALRELTEDPALAGAALERIEGGQDAASAIHAAGMAMAEQFAAAENEYFRARAQDVHDVTRHLVDTLLGTAPSDLGGIAEDCILVADSLSAVEFARLPKRHLLGLLLLGAGRTSHVAIMAGALGLPLVLADRAQRTALRGARRIALDGGAGHAILEPDAATTERFEAEMRQAQHQRAELKRLAGTVTQTRAGRVIEIVANIGSVMEAAVAREHGAAGIGLFRTELLFMQGRRLPSEEDQYYAYRTVIETMAGHKVTIRTLDVGGDKKLPGVETEPEENPFLGWRGIRMCLDRPDLFKPQLRALLRAAAHGPLRVMFPMISDVDEFRAARALVASCAADLAAEGAATGPVELGVMIETPAAALCAEALAAEAEFFSIGTNDLTQYVMAADRAHRRLGHLSRPDHPAVARAIQMTCAAAAARGIPVAVCGEMAADPAHIPSLVAWGVTELSMSAPAVPRAKQAVVQL